MLAVLFPALLHGAYDYIASMEQTDGNWYFIGFVAVMFLVSFLLVGKAAKKDQFISA